MTVLILGAADAASEPVGVLQLLAVLLLVLAVLLGLLAVFYQRATKPRPKPKPKPRSRRAAKQSKR